MSRTLAAASLVVLALGAVAGSVDASPTLATRASSTRGVGAMWGSGELVTGGCSDHVVRDVQYLDPPGDPPAQTTLDVHPAPGACTVTPGPIVVWVHGGGWSFGDKEPVGAKLHFFHGLGAAVVSVDYRLAPVADGDPGVQHPVQAEDVASAVAWAAGHAAEFGADGRRVMLVGHSAGGQLVSLLGTDPRYLHDAGLPDGALRGVVALDTEGYDLTQKVSQGGLSAALIVDAFGDDPAVWHDASPITHAGDEAGVVPFLVVTRGTRQRQHEAAAFVRAMRKAGAEVRVVLARGYSHQAVDRRLGEPGETLETPPVRGFVLAHARA